MRAYLEESNQDLLYQIAVVQELLGKTSVCGELTPYVGQIIQICEALRRQAQRNLTDLGYGLDDTLNDILAATQSVTNFFEVVNTRLAAPVVCAQTGGPARPPGSSLPSRLSPQDGQLAIRFIRRQFRRLPHRQDPADLPPADLKANDSVVSAAALP